LRKKVRSVRASPKSRVPGGDLQVAPRLQVLEAADLDHLAEAVDLDRRGGAMDFELP
jgi:hypothetical protein